MSRSEQWRERDRAVMWHPFTQMQDWANEAFPVIESAEGFELIDVDGNRYLDGISSLWCNVHGHRHPVIDEAIRTQLDTVAHTTQLGLAATGPIELAELLLTLVPDDLTRVFYSDSGATSVEIALKMAYQYWRQNGQPDRNVFLTLGGAYHGDTIGSISLGGISVFHDAFKDLLFASERKAPPNGYRRPEGIDREAYEEQCIVDLIATVEERSPEIAAVVLEPLVQGAAGIITQPPEFLRRVREVTRAHDVFIICDEAATGFYRTGKRFACDHESVAPDILCVAKGLSGGVLPLAATITTERIYEGFLAPHADGRHFFHGHTFTGNNLACAAAIANLELMETESFQANVAALNALLDRELPRFNEIPAVGDVRRCGLMVGIELVADRETVEPFPAEERVGHAVICAARERGVILRPLGDVIVLMPAPGMPVAVLGKIVDTAYQAIASVTTARDVHSGHS
jgi:adenosylmethionine-8-amino-7-oxononanoate aminotransferase